MVREHPSAEAVVAYVTKLPPLDQIGLFMVSHGRTRNAFIQGAINL